MKKVIITFVFLHLFTLASNAQIFTSVTYYDKFDDIIKKEQRKTLIEQTDSTFIIEEKGKKPVVYYIVNQIDKLGSKDDVVNLVGNVYGYEESWCLVRYDLLKQYNDTYERIISEYLHENLLEDTPVRREKLKVLEDYWLFATYRTVTTQYTGSYITALFWIKDEDNKDKLGKGVNRIIYNK